MKHAIVFIFLSLLAFQSQGQRNAPGQNIQRVRAAKIDYITTRLSLTDQQAEEFWPVYHRYEEEVRVINRRAFDKLHDRRQPPLEGDADALRSIDSRLNTQEEIIAVQRKYKAEFLRVISAEQILALYDAEREFNRMVMQRVRQQRGGRQKIYYGPGRN